MMQPVHGTEIRDVDTTLAELEPEDVTTAPTAIQEDS